MRLGVDARVLAHAPTGVARYLTGLLGEWPDLKREGDSMVLYLDGPVHGSLPGEPDSVRVLRWPLPGGDPAWRQIRLAFFERIILQHRHGGMAAARDASVFCDNVEWCLAFLRSQRNKKTFGFR